MDAGLRELHASRRPHTGQLAVVAVGGYGRQELCPASDIDLLLLVDGLDDEAEAAAVRDLVYPLWDAALRVGHAVRAPRLAVSAALDDVDIATATLDARLVAGDAELLRRLRSDLLDRLQRRPGRLLEGLAASDAARRARHGDTAETQEPNLKDGAGGLRDVQSLRWAAAALHGAATLDALVTGRELAAADRTRLARAYDLLLSVRVALHLTAGVPTDVLSFDHQKAVADRLDLHRPGVTAADALLHEVFLAARAIDHVHRCAWALVAADARRSGSRHAVARRFRRPVDRRLAGGFVETDGVLRIEPSADLDDPGFPTRLLDALATTGAALERTGAARIGAWLAGRDGALPWDHHSRQRLLDVLWRGSAGVHAFAELDDLGLLAALIPEWQPLRGRPQRNPFHRFSLDRHALHAAAGLGDLVREEDWAAQQLQTVDDRDGLMLGTLLHDVGKAHGEPHSQTGVPVADAIARRLGAGATTRALVGRLVRWHLLLPEVATRRDLSDPALIAEVAATIGDRQTLACLHLLAAADGAATGPSAWSAWKASLVAELVRKVAHVLDDEPTDTLADGAAATAHVAEELAPAMGVDLQVVRAHLGMLPSRYAAAVSPRAVVRHAAMAAQPLAPAEVRPRVTPGADSEGSLDELDVVAVDRPGLFAKVAGVLAIHGGSVLSAHAFTRSDGVAVDTFRVRRPRTSEAGERPGAWWVSVEGDLVEAVAGRLALRARVARKAAAQRRPSRSLPEVAVRVEVQPDASGDATVVEVHCEDRLGVLHRITAALAELELDIVAAKIDTVGHEVIDAFYVRDVGGAPLDDDHAAEVVLAVSAALEA